MPVRKFRIPYGRTSLQFRLPASMRVHVASSHKTAPVQNAVTAIREALGHPLGSSPLHRLARSGDRVCIVFTDITRPSPDHLLIPALLEELFEAGVKDDDITLLCGTGMHRPSTALEKVTKLGAKIVSRYRVLDHDAQNGQNLVDLGRTPGGAPILVNRLAVEADLLIATGTVEPHQYAGYSGGRKATSIGVGGEALIAFTHGPVFVDHPGTRLGRIDGNPFHEVITEVARRASLRYILNVVQDEKERILCVAAGNPEVVFQELVAFARPVYEVNIPHACDIAIGGIGYPKDSNLYQASRAPTYLYFAPTPVVRPGGFLIISARCEEGAGKGVGEVRFLAAMRDAPDIQSILEGARRNGYPPGQQRAYILARVLEQTRIVIVGSECPDLVSACKMTPASTMDEALDMACKEIGPSCRVLVVPHAMLTLPVISTE